MISNSEFLCPTCGKPTRQDKIFVTMWLGAELNLIDDVPAHICDGCGLQYYDSDVEDKIRALVTAGFPRHKAIRQISVPVFNLDGARPHHDIVAAARLVQEAQEVPQS